MTEDADAPLADLATGDVVYFPMYFPQNCGPGWTVERRGVVIQPGYRPTKRDYALNAWRGLEKDAGATYTLLQLDGGELWIVNTREVTTPANMPNTPR